jgi:type IV fimbrial biogenesis protein FimT
MGYADDHLLGHAQGRSLLMRRHASRGISIIELMVVITMIGIMLTLAIPGIGNWISNSRVRTVAEELQNGLRVAQAEAVNRNRTVAYVRTAATPARNATPSATGSNWYVQVLPINAVEGATSAFQNDAYVQGGTFSAQSGANVTGTDTTVVCFNSVGRVVNVTATDTGLGVACVAPTTADIPARFAIALPASDRAMRVELSLGGRVRMCDPLAATGQPNACTP